EPLLRLDAGRYVLDERQDRHDPPLLVEQARVVPLAPDRFAILAVVAIESGRARLLAGHQLFDELGHRRTIGFVRQLAAGDPDAQDLLRTPPEDVLGLRRPPHQAEIAVPFEHRQRRVVDVRRQHPVGATQRFLVALLVVNVGVHGVDADDVAFAVAVRRVVNRLPSLLAVRLHQHLLGRYRLAGKHAVHQRLQLPRAGIADDFADLPTGQVLATFRQPFLVVRVEEAETRFPVDVGDAGGNVVHDQPELPLAGAEGFLRL